MANFTELFTATLNETIAKLVADAVARVEEKYEAQIVEMQGRIQDLEEADIVDVDSAVERAIENYDFSDIVRDNMDADSIFDRREFADAVKEVIAEALR